MDKENEKQPIAPVIFISYSLPPISLNPKLEYKKNLQDLGQFLSNFSFKSIIVISSQYIKPDVTYISSSYKYQTIHDHPYEEFFDFTYKAHGSLEIAQDILQFLQVSHDYQNCELDDEWGLDHGAWIPLSIMFPELKAPVIQISLDSKLEQEDHSKLANALFELRRENHLILCCGGFVNNQQLTYQTLNTYKTPKIEKKIYEQIKAFISCMEKICEERIKKLKDFKKIPYFDVAHPLHNKYIPLYIALLAAKDSLGKPINQELYKECVSLNCYIFCD